MPKRENLRTTSAFDKEIMISFICGEIADIVDNTVVINNNGIGFELTVSNLTLIGLKIGEKTQLFTYMQVREDDISLFGFTTTRERDMFLKLTSVAGVGPKVALTVLSSYNLDDLALNILEGNAAALTRVKGLGKKTAERIILELKEKISPFEIVSNRPTKPQANQMTTEGEQAVDLLVSLGLKREEAQQKVLKCIADGNESCEQILANALRS